MADKKLKFKIATPERVVYEADVDSITCMTEMGEITILPGHIPLVANLKPGELRVRGQQGEEPILVVGGFIEVREDDNVVILADAAETPEEIDLARAEEARDRARKVMSQERISEEEYAETLAALERSLARIRVGQKKRYRDVGKQI